jgi:hypothetical protein
MRALGGGMNEVECSAKQAVELRSPSIKEELIRKKERYRVMLKDIEEAIAALEDNPAVETVLNLIAKTGRY